LIISHNNKNKNIYPKNNYHLIPISQIVYP